MVSEIIFIVVGIGVLLASGDILVRGAVELARALRIPALLVSLTIVAFGTSAPELVVAVQAVMSGNDGIALGNIVGSNVANVLMVLGLPAIIYPIATVAPGINRHIAVMLAATAAFAAAAYVQQSITPMVGCALFASICLYIAYTGWRAANGATDDILLDDVEEYGDASVSTGTIVFILFGLLGLPLGAHLLVENGAALAYDLGVRDEIIGLTIVAFGTSLPELATVAVAAFHKKSDVAIGNIVGSNIFNLLAVGGAAGLAGGATFDPSALTFDLPIMIASSVILAGFVFTKSNIGRLAGFAMLFAYVVFIGSLAATARIPM